MTPETVLLRQVHPSFVQAGRVTSQVFRPTPKDRDRLSVEDGDRISAEAAWVRFTTRGYFSVGVLGVSCDECQELDLELDEDGEPDPEHVSILFDGRSQSERERLAKRLRSAAERRGWLHGPQPSSVL